VAELIATGATNTPIEPLRIKQVAAK